MLSPRSVTQRVRGAARAGGAIPGGATGGRGPPAHGGTRAVRCGPCPGPRLLRAPRSPRSTSVHPRFPPAGGAGSEDAQAAEPRGAEHSANPMSGTVRAVQTAPLEQGVTLPTDCSVLPHGTEGDELRVFVLTVLFWGAAYCSLSFQLGNFRLDQTRTWKVSTEM